MKFTKDDLKRSMLLYAVTDRSWLKNGETLAAVCEQAIKNGVTFLQIREKDIPIELFEKEALPLKKLCEKYRIPFVVNDSVEIAMKIDADGVHVGQSDIKGRDIRSIIGPDKLLGISAATVQEAVAAQNAGADYIGVGAVFGTSTKKNARTMTVERLNEISQSVDIPVVAIGGINEANISKLYGSKIDGVAVVSAIFASDDPGAAAARLLKLAKKL